VLNDPAVDSVIAIYIPVLATTAPEIAEAIRDSSLHANGKTMLATFMSSSGSPMPLDPVPAFSFPERAARALALATRYSEWKRTPVGLVPHFEDIDRPRLRSIVDASIQSGGGWLDATAVDSMLGAVGIGAPGLAFAQTPGEAVDAAMRLGFPAALKAQGPELLHKSDAGGVKLSLRDENAVYEAYEAMASSLGSRMTGVVVQAMVSDGVEMMIGATYDPSFGHVIAAGAGGTLVEMIDDVSFRLQPLNTADPDAMLADLRCARLLRGFRGSAPADIDALRSTILRVSALLEICPEIREIDLNPVKVRTSGALAVDARIRVEKLVQPQPSLRIAY
jgi:Acyl-CoA synthetase (NDP forming)